MIEFLIISAYNISNSAYKFVIQLKEDSHMNKDGGNVFDGKKVGEALSGFADNIGK